VDRILNDGRMFINVLGNAVATIVIGIGQRDFDGRACSDGACRAAPVATGPMAVPEVAAR
jgi:Na+/H+-dicarboxylate symporter